MPELSAEQRLRDDAIVRGIIAQAQREAAQAVLDAVEKRTFGWENGTVRTVAHHVRDAARAAAAKYGAGQPEPEKPQCACWYDPPCPWCIERGCVCPDTGPMQHVASCPAAGGDGR